MSDTINYDTDTTTAADKSPITPADAIKMLPEAINNMLEGMLSTSCAGHQLAVGLVGLMTVKELEDVIAPPSRFQRAKRSAGLALVAVGGRIVSRS